MVIALSACSNLQKPVATSGRLISRGKIDDPRLKHFACLQQHGLPVTEPNPTEIQVGPAGQGPLMKFLATPGMAQGVQIAGSAQAAYVVGNALVYPNQAPYSELQVIDGCAAIGVTG
jgi:hypothetical protein